MDKQTLINVEFLRIRYCRILFYSKFYSLSVKIYTIIDILTFFEFTYIDVCLMHPNQSSEELSS